MIPFCKTFYFFVFVFFYSSLQIVCYTCVQNGIAFVCEHINVIHFISKNKNQNNNITCHPERRKTLAFCAVEVLRVEPWRTSKTEERTRRWDLQSSLGGLPMQMLLSRGKTPKFVTRSLRRFAPCFHLVIHSVKVRLRSG